MNEPPLFSVVMPAYDTAATVEGAIRSVLEQSEPRFELLVVDDGSRDDTADRAERVADPRVRVVRQENLGAAAARNEGIRRSAGRLVAFIDSDDFWLPGYLAGMSALFERDPDVGLLYTDAWVLDPSSLRVATESAMHWQRPPDPPPASAEAFLEQLLDRNFVYSATVVPRAIFERLGAFDESLRAAIDYEMWLRIVAAGYRAACLPGLNCVYRRDRPGSISADRSKVLASLVDVYERVAGNGRVAGARRAQAARRAEEIRRELDAFRFPATSGARWRRVVRPAIVRARNVVLRKDRWRRDVPAELRAALPWVFQAA